MRINENNVVNMMYCKPLRTLHSKNANPRIAGCSSRKIAPHHAVALWMISIKYVVVVVTGPFVWQTINLDWLISQWYNVSASELCVPIANVTENIIYVGFVLNDGCRIEFLVCLIYSEIIRSSFLPLDPAAGSDGSNAIHFHGSFNAKHL